MIDYKDIASLLTDKLQSQTVDQPITTSIVDGVTFADLLNMHTPFSVSDDDGGYPMNMNVYRQLEALQKRITRRAKRRPKLIRQNRRKP